MFPEDIGIVTAMYGIDTVVAINRGNLEQGKGAIYEALVFDSLSKAGLEPYYFAKGSGLEIDLLYLIMDTLLLWRLKLKQEIQNLVKQ